MTDSATLQIILQELRDLKDRATELFGSVVEQRTFCREQVKRVSELAERVEQNEQDIEVIKVKLLSSPRVWVVEIIKALILAGSVAAAIIATTGSA